MLVEPDPRGKRSRIPNLSAAAGIFLLLGLIAFGAAVLWTLAGARPDELAEASGGPETGRVRRDAVRELAISRGIIPETAIPGAQPLGPVQAPQPE